MKLERRSFIRCWELRYELLMSLGLKLKLLKQLFVFVNLQLQITELPGQLNDILFLSISTIHASYMRHHFCIKVVSYSIISLFLSSIIFNLRLFHKIGFICLNKRLWIKLYPAQLIWIWVFQSILTCLFFDQLLLIW